LVQVSKPDTPRVGDFLRASEGRVFCARRRALVMVGHCSTCGFGTRLTREEMGGDIVRCTVRAQDLLIRRRQGPR
jgi:hypothetical protein